MASIQEKSRTRSLNADVNLVPFIDFLSTCICFLLLTAVWIQISNLEVKQAFGVADAANNISKNELEIQFKSSHDMILNLKEKNKIKKSFTLNFQNDISTKLPNLIREIKKQYPFDSATITTSSLVIHENFVQVLDSLRGEGVQELGVNHGI